MIKMTVNGQDYQFEDLAPRETLVDLLRGQLRLTGTKFVCGSGVCGACTVLVDDQPMTSCLLPAHQADGRNIQTVEFHGPDNLHPVQRAFITCDALQCGFCTPGLINSSISFYEKWRLDHQGEMPDRETVSSALAGHLCRCGAYAGIIEAMQRACAGEFDALSEAHSPRIEAVDKVTGSAKFTVDHYYDGQLEGVLLRSIHAHARVRNIDASAALAMPRVVSFVEMLPDERLVRYAGQEIGALAAEDRQTAELALKKIKVDYEVFHAAIGMAAALQDDSPLCYDGFIKRPLNASEGIIFPSRWQRNRRKNLMNMFNKAPRKARGQIQQARSRDDVHLIEHTFENAVQVHTTLEPHVCLANWEDPFHLTVHLSTQAIHHAAHIIAEHFDIEDDNVLVIADHIGGGFGGKQGVSIEGIAAITLARKAERPVRVLFDRHEEISYAALRPGAEVQLSLLIDENGEPDAISMNIHSDSGVAVGSNIVPFISWYAPDALKNLDEYDVVNHTPPGKPFRGPNGPQTFWALEQSLDEAASRLATDPITLRKKWYPDEPLRHSLLDWAASLHVWQNRNNGQQNGRYKCGVGLAMGAWPFIYNGDAQVMVGVGNDGIFVRSSTQDIGTGTRTVLATVVAEVFGMSPLDIIVDMGHSQAPLGPASGGSQAANSVVGPAVHAAERLRDSLLNAAKSQFGLIEPQIAAEGIKHNAGILPWDATGEIETRSFSEKRGSEPNLIPLLEALSRDKHTASIGKAVSYAVTISEVMVDTSLGKVDMTGVWMGVAVGKIFTQRLARSQIEGGIIQGIGYALYEDRQIDGSRGFTLNANLEDYKIPGIGDIPPMEIFFIEEGFEDVRAKGVGIGELATVGVAASIGNAVFHATGWRPLNTPIKTQDILQGVRA